MPDRAEIARAVARELRERGASREQIEAAIAKVMAEPPVSALPQMPIKPDASAVSSKGTGDFGATVPGLLGIAASAPQAIPGVEALQAGANSLLYGQPYKESLEELRSVTNTVPLPIKLAAQAPAILATGGLGNLSPAKAGAAYGAASQALSADPMSVGDRILRTVAGGAAGSVAGKAADIVGAIGRTHIPKLRPPKPGEVAGALEETMRAADNVNYPAAIAEGESALGTRSSLAIRKVLESPDIKPIADEVRASRQFANASDARILSETYKQMSKTQGGLLKGMETSGYNAKAGLQADDITLAKKELLDASDDIMPSFRNAVGQHREMAGEIKALGTGVDAAKRVMGTSVSGNKLTTKSPEAYAGQIRDMGPRNKAAAIMGARGELRERTGIQPDISSLGGVLPAALRSSKMSSFFRDIGDTEQLLMDHFIRSGMFGGASVAQ